jgi:hypothetical protein
MNKEEYNIKWTELNQEIQKLNRERRKLYDDYVLEHGTLNLKIERNISVYYDLNGVDIDIFERN